MNSQLSRVLPTCNVLWRFIIFRSRNYYYYLIYRYSWSNWNAQNKKITLATFVYLYHFLSKSFDQLKTLNKFQSNLNFLNILSDVKSVIHFTDRSRIMLHFCRQCTQCTFSSMQRHLLRSWITYYSNLTKRRVGTYELASVVYRK